MFLQTLDNGLNILQLETAVGAGIQNFDGAIGQCFHMNNVISDI